MSAAREAFREKAEDPDQCGADIIDFSRYRLPKPAPAPAPEEKTSPICSRDFLNRVETAATGYTQKEDLMASLYGTSAPLGDYALLRAYEQTHDRAFLVLRADLWREVPNKQHPTSPNMSSGPRKRTHGLTWC